MYTVQPQGQTLVDAPQVQQPSDVESLVVQRKDDLLRYVQNFYRASWDWRNRHKHEKWNKWDRNYHSIYDPTKLARKEKWQTTMFIGLTVQTVEVISSQVFKTMMAPKPPIQTIAGPAGDELQAQLIQEVMDYELRRSNFETHFYDALKECVRFGSGFMKFMWEKIDDTRPRRTPVYQSADQVVKEAPAESIRGLRPMPAPRITGFEIQNQRVQLRNNLSAKFVHIRDVFPEPNAREWKNVLHRDKITFGEIVQHIKTGGFLPEAKDKLEYLTEPENFEQDIRQTKYDRGYYEQNRDKSRFEKKHTIWELYCSIPRKWIDFAMPEGDDAEELVPAKVMVASGCALLSSEANPFFDGECPILKMDYIRTGEPYGKGVIELIEDEQDEINELRNLRVDNVNLIINKMIAIIETALVNPKDLVSKPGGIIRLKANVGDDIRKAIYPMDFSDITSSAYKETFEIERAVQERTGANRVTLGTSTEVRDSNQTLGGMELLRQTFNERLAAYGMLMESDFLLRGAAKIYSLIYQNLKPEDLFPILGDDPVIIAPPQLPGGQPVTVPRFAAFVFPSPETVSTAYMFKPMGIFSLENKIVKAAQVMDLIRINATNPRFDFNAACQYVATKLQGISEAEKWFLPPMQLPGLGMPGMGTPVPQEAPGMKGGPNGNQPNFLPPDPLRRQPIVG